ncbi:MAG: four helix bundle protein [Anaerolineae bacterium]|nr:four helix bundle protein [Anaerolineae bacterium]
MMVEEGSSKAELARGFESLAAWQKARELMLFVHRELVPLLPPEEKWDLASQLRRSSKSIMSNIAEGYGRYYYQETIRFCYLARGSLDETINHLRTSFDLGYVSRECYEEARMMADECRRVLNGYIAFLKRERRGNREPGNPYILHDERNAFMASDGP